MRAFFLISVFVFSLFKADFVLGTDEDLLQVRDIQLIMQQILKEHIEDSKVTNEIIQQSFQRYIDQFDPYRTYLLQEEVIPFLRMNQGQLDYVRKQYQQGQFSLYWQLNNVIQKAVERSQKIRKELTGQRQALFNQNIEQTSLKERKERPFAKKIGELKKRIRESFVEFVDLEKERLGQSQAKKYLGEIASFYDTRMQEFENTYLFLNRKGAPLLPQKRESLFVLHVVKALSSSLDAHTKFYTPSEAYDLRLQLEKELEGIGVEIQMREGRVVITRLISESPAERGGVLKPNDELISVDGTPVSGMSLDEVGKRLRGKEGTTVALTVKRNLREGNRTVARDLSVTVERGVIALDSERVDTSFIRFGDGIIGKIKLYDFYQNPELKISSEEDVKKALEELQSEGNLKGVVLDLRDNSGGFLTQAVKVAGLFMSNGVVVVSKYADGKERFFRDLDGKTNYEGPLLILTSRLTASAAEIVAQALQDYGIALVVGDAATFGKGTVQRQTVTEEEGASFYKVTVGKYYTPSGKTPDVQGVQADIVVPGIYSKESFAHESSAPHTNTIREQFQDSLGDVGQDMKPWYMRYYIPTLQSKKVIWKNMLPILRRNSQYRIENSRNYQHFLSELSGEERVEEELSSGHPSDPGMKNHGKEDLQLDESINILKDMIILESRVDDTYQ